MLEASNVEQGNKVCDALMWENTTCTVTTAYNGVIVINIETNNGIGER